jgi:hypothetical protein
LGLASCSEKAAYTRAECIIRIDIDSELTGHYFAQAITNALDAIHIDPKNTYLGPYPSSSIQYDKKAIYFQFSEQCESKLHWGKELVRLRMQPASPNGFKLTVSSDKVIPDIKTILVTGDAWID